MHFELSLGTRISGETKSRRRYAWLHSCVQIGKCTSNRMCCEAPGINTVLCNWTDESVVIAWEAP